MKAAMWMVLVVLALPAGGWGQWKTPTLPALPTLVGVSVRSGQND